MDMEHPPQEPLGPTSAEVPPTVRQRALKPLGAGVLALVGIGAIVWAITFDVGSLDRPGAGLWPVALGGALTLGAAVFLVVNRDGKEGAFGREQVDAVIAVASIIAFILLFQHVHFVPAALVLMAGCQFAAGARRPVPIAVTCVLATAAAWVLFFVVLGVSTPL
ncbi:hypothetical protein BH708_10420 [Brachybacterium sp. P6-10-X1]|uniref:tripartite tricarboxylate transporter TctB family protein n=1 Tax=Brachybacterium sp. P6-10-X1 TaxID=1903186 RepID=UPI0009719D89|nr:tripartite tricarboxylate transporter TctB family protein [Brachybacterium sp. P6-10-X1]APX33055.1 hypothetical protein BH708_10420 [Brachybacterium sp. P6-10-X1]